MSNLLGLVTLSLKPTADADFQLTHISGVMLLDADFHGDSSYNLHAKPSTDL